MPIRSRIISFPLGEPATAGREEGLQQSPPQRPRCSRRIAFTPAAMPPVPLPPPSFARRLPSAVSSVSSSPPSPLRCSFAMACVAKSEQIVAFCSGMASRRPCFARFSQRGGRFPRQLARMPPRHSPCPLARRHTAPHPRTPPGKTKEGGCRSHDFTATLSFERKAQERRSPHGNAAPM